MTEISARAFEWAVFSLSVFDHIESYTVPQYGDAPDDQVEDWDAGACIRQIGKYTARFKNNARGQAELQRDMYKIAHYACLAASKLNR